MPQVLRGRDDQGRFAVVVERAAPGQVLADLLEFDPGALDQALHAYLVF